MSQLYYLKNGGIGHFDDLCKEETIEILRFLTMQELIEGAELLKDTGTAYFANEEEMLQEAITILQQSQALTPEKLTKALETIADIEYTKRFHADDVAISLATEQIMADLSKKAESRGYRAETETKDEEEKK